MEPINDPRRYLFGVVIPQLFEWMVEAGVNGIKVKRDAYDRMKQRFGVVTLSRESGATDEQVMDFVHQCCAFASEHGLHIVDRSTPSILLASHDPEVNVTLVQSDKHVTE